MKVKLLKTHYHANKLYLPDDELEVSNETAHWLVEHGVAEPIKETKKSEKSVTQEQENA